MVEALNKLFTVTLKLSPDVWLVIALVTVVAAFLVTLLAGLLGGEFKKVKGLMNNAVNKPSSVIAVMQKMPITVSKQYKRARIMNIKPSDLVTEQECVLMPYKRSLISKVWIATFVATVVAAGIAFVAGPIAYAAAREGGSDVNDAVLVNATYLMPLIVLIVGGLLTLVGAILSRCAYGGAVKTFAKFVAVIDGDAADKAQAQPQQQQPVAQQNAGAYVFDNAEHAEPNAEYNEEPQTVFAEESEPVAEHTVTENEPVFEPVISPVVEQEDDEEIRRRAREEAIAAMREQQERAEAEARERAEAEAREKAEAEARERAEAEARERAEAEARAKAEAEARARAEAIAAQEAAKQAQAAQGSSSADDVIARIEQIDREGAPRETMREVATLLQKERAKPENKTPEQQKRLNEALSKLLKAMSAASKK